jgi:tetratricopeptide (TPR) repeat protein
MELEYYKRIPDELSHEKTPFYFDVKTMLPPELKSADFHNLISFYTKKCQSKTKVELSNNYHLRGCVYFDNIHYKSALFDFQEAEKFDNNPVLYYYLGCVYQTLDRNEKIEYYSKKSLELYLDFVLSLDFLAYCFGRVNVNRSNQNNFVECVRLLIDVLSWILIIFLLIHF